jgi:2-isopropylmalate synthase
MKRHVVIYDTTLREGSQCVGISLTVADRIRLFNELDNLGVDFIECGLAGGSPKDDAFYKELANIRPVHAKPVAFGSPLKPYEDADKSPMLKALLEAGTEYVTVFGKASSFQAREILGVTEGENLSMIEKTVSRLVLCGKKVFFDAEHYFDGFSENREYALDCLRTALGAGAECVVLCDTNGGVLPYRQREIIDETLREMPEIEGKFGIHAHNDSGAADYATVEAVLAGAFMAQVAVNGWGERCGNANLFTVVPNLTLKLGCDCIPDLGKLYSFAQRACEISNTKMWDFSPYVGRNAFSHKAGVHIDAVRKNSSSYEHVPPEAVGNSRRIMLSEQSGRAAVIAKVGELLPKLGCDADSAALIIDKIKELELEGYRFEGADASFEMLVKELLGIRRSWFILNTYKVVVFDNDAGEKYAAKQIEQEPGTPQIPTASAIVDVTVDGREEITAANGIGPVDALDKALRKALTSFYPVIGRMHLVDYKVRVLESTLATASVVRVVVESSDGTNKWCTVGVSGDIIKASFDALVDSYDFMLDNFGGIN